MLWKVLTLARKILKKNGFEIRKIRGSFSNPTSQIRNEILPNCPGILHIGAHIGQEAPIYDQLGLNVIWIEADPVIYDELKIQIQSRKNHRAFLALLGNQEGENINFYRTSNHGQSSSVYPLAKDLDFNYVAQVDTVQLQMQTLDTLFSDESLKEYPYWLLDVQGAELLVLEGAQKNLEYCQFLEIEVSTFYHYQSQPLFDELTTFLGENSFFPIWRPFERFHGNVLYLRKPIQK